MTVCASGSGRGACATARVFLATYVLALAVGWAGAEAEQARPSGASPPTVTLSTLITGTCLEIHRYAESVVGSGVIRSAAEVTLQRRRAARVDGDSVSFHQEVALNSSFSQLFNTLIYWISVLTLLFALSLFWIYNCT